MKRFISYLLLIQKYSISLCLLFYLNLYAQDPLLDRASTLVDTNPEETIKIGELLLKNNQYKSHYDSINLLVAQGHYVKGNYDLALQHLFTVSNKNQSSELTFNTYLLKSDILRKIHLHRQLNLYIEKSQSLMQEHRLKDEKGQQIKINSILIKAFLDRQEVSKADSLWELSNKHYNGLDDSEWLLIKAKIVEELHQTDSAITYYERALLLGKKQPNVFLQTYALLGLSRMYFDTKEYERAIDTLLKAKDNALKLENKFLLATINNQLSNNYLALKDQEEHNKSYNEFLIYKTSSEKIESDAVNVAYRLINQEHEDIYNLKAEQYKGYLTLSVWVLIIIVLITVFYFYRNRLKVKRFEEILKYLQASNSLPIKQPLPIKKESKKTNIPPETEQALLNKLKRFEVSGNFTNKEMSLANLASQFETNTKYLSEIINKHYNDNFNMYINRLRINYIIGKLKADPNYLNYKISYLADQSGFSSHSSFATVFKSITGIAPTTFIDLMQKENEKNKKHE